MKGNLILNTSSPTNALQAASKGYVDNSTKLKRVLNKVTFNSSSEAYKLQFVEEYTDASIIFIYFTGSGGGDVYVGTDIESGEYFSFYIDPNYAGVNYNCKSYLLVNMGNKVFASSDTAIRGNQALYYAAASIDLKSSVYVFSPGVNSLTAEAFAIM